MATEKSDLDLEEQLAILGVDLGGVVNEAPAPAAQVQSTPVSIKEEIPAPQEEIVTSVKQAVNTIVANEQVSAQVVQPTQTTPQTTVGVTHQNIPPVQSNTSDEVVFIDLAKAVNTQKTPWLRLKDGERSRILIPDLKKVIPIRVHYMKGLGFFKCLSSYTPEGWLDQPAECCCKRNEAGTMMPRLDEEGKEIKSKRRYLVPVIEYPVNKDNHNQLVPGQQPQLKMWNMNYVEWGDLLSAVQGCADNPDDLSTADISSIDFSLFKDASSQFKTIKVTVTPKTFRPQFEAQIQGELSKMTQDFFKDSLKEARKILPIETIVNSYNAQEAMNDAVNSAIENPTMGNQGLDI